MPKRLPYLNYAIQGAKKFGVKKIFAYGRNFLLVKAGHALQMPIAAPLSVNLALTYACNLKCGFCNLPERDREFRNDPQKAVLSQEDILGLIRQAKEIGSGSVTITGGEPLTHPHIRTFIRAIQQAKLVSHITSSGWYLSETMAKDLVEAGLDGITLSLHGSNPEVHDAVVGRPGAYERLVNGIKYLQEAAKAQKKTINISINSVVHEGNFADIPSIFQIAEDLGVRQVTFNPVHQVDVLEHPELLQNLDPDPVKAHKKLDDLIDFLIAKKRSSNLQTNSEAYFRLLKDFFMGKPFPAPCVAGHASLTIDGFGDYFACFPHFENRKSYGNIRKSPLKEYWNGEGIKPMRQQAKECRDCYWNCQSEVNLLFKRVPFA